MRSGSFDKSQMRFMCEKTSYIGFRVKLNKVGLCVGELGRDVALGSRVKHAPYFTVFSNQ